MSRTIGIYKIYNQIGKGSFGKVYKGTNTVTNEEVALKFIQKKQKRSRDLKNLKQQNQLLKKINHPNVICLKDVIDTEKEIIIITDYAGRDLAGVIEQKKKFTYDKVKQYSIQILNAMLYLNDNRIIHRDLKPQNILIKNNHIKICDFGFAKKLSASTNFLQSMKGTPLYLAPQIVRQTKYTEKVDIWSFGCIIYELFTGRTPYYANTYQKLAPLILYQQVQYPKQMPAQLKDLICSMLQKNPSARPNWKQLKDHSFFKPTDALKQKIQNQLKQVISIEIPDRTTVYQMSQYKENKENKESKENKENNLPINIIESKVIQKLDNKNEIEAYEKEFNKIYADLLANNIDALKLRTDVLFFLKIKDVLHQKSELNPLITNNLIDTILNILNHLIKSRRNVQGGTQQQAANNQNGSQEDDITKNQALIVGLLCLAKVQRNYVMLEKQLRMICLLIKRNFNGVSINTEIDQDITQFITQILLQNYNALPIECIRNGLIIIGTLANQAMMTLGNSYTYFQRVAEDNLLSKIANIFKKQQKSAIVLQCIKQFIHPGRQVASMNGKNPNNILHPKISNVFKTLRQQTAQSLLKTEFLSDKSPLQVYSDKNTHIVDYCQIMLQCLLVSKQFRAQFLKYNYWKDLLSSKKTRMFLFAYNAVFKKQEDKWIIPKDIISEFTKQSQDNKLININIVQMGYDNLKKKVEKLNGKVPSKEISMFQRSILQSVYQLVFSDQINKSKSCKEVYGALQTTSNKFDEPLISVFTQITSKLTDSQIADQNRQFCCEIFKKICSTTCTFKPNCRSLYNLMTLFTQNPFIREMKTQKSVVTYFYECLSDYIKRQDFEYLEVSFPDEKMIHNFMEKFVNCMNWLIEIDQSQGKQTKQGAGGLSQNCLNLSKQIQTSSFYRFMFMDNLSEDHFYQNLKYCQKILSKANQNDAEFVNFMGVKAIPMSKKYFGTKKQHILIEIFSFMAQISRDHSQFHNDILCTQIVRKFKQWLTQNTYSQSLKERLLYLIGNMAKRSQFFFGQFESFGVIQAINTCLQNNFNHQKIVKNVIYSVGNISYYTQKFHKQIFPMIPYLAKTFQMNDLHLRNNLISTVSNLLRFSNIYLSALIKTEMITFILQLACEAKQTDQALQLALSVIKKILPYEQFYKRYGYGQLKIIYQKRNICGGQSNQTIRKIKEVLQKVKMLD